MHRRQYPRHFSLPQYASPHPQLVSFSVSGLKHRHRRSHLRIVEVLRILGALTEPSMIVQSTKSDGMYLVLTVDSSTCYGH